MQEPASDPPSVWAALGQIYQHLPAARRRQFYVLVVLMLLGAVAELATIGSVLPFLAFLAHGPAANLPHLANIFVVPGSGSSSVLAAAIVFAAFAIAAGVLRVCLAWVSQKFVFGLSHDFALEALRRILQQPYEFHTERDVATLLAATEKVDIMVFDLLLPAVQGITAAFIAAFLVAGLLYIDPAATMIAAAAFGGIYFAVSLVTRRRLEENSVVAGDGYNARLKIVNESLGGIRDVIIDNSESVHLALFDEVNSRLCRAKATTAFIAASPRFIIESVGMVVIAGIAVLVSGREGGIGLALPFVGALALGAQRLLPLVQSVYNGWSLGAGNRSVVGQVMALLNLPLPAHEGEDEPIALSDKITFDNVSFTYPTRPGAPALSAITFDVPAGSMVALVGTTGSGKTTAADLLMALLKPTDGQILIDSSPLTPAKARAWRRNIAHVPQAIFLADTSIARNIALGLPGKPVDRDAVVEAAKKAQLHDFVESLPEAYDTIVGERGIRLSGGQRQRVGIARAIYKGAPVLILDEATSALDEATEASVIDALDELRRDGLTIIIVSHRASTIRRCDFIVRIEGGRIVAAGDVSEVIGSAASLTC